MAEPGVARLPLSATLPLTVLHAAPEVQVAEPSVPIVSGVEHSLLLSLFKRIEPPRKALFNVSWSASA